MNNDHFVHFLLFTRRDWLCSSTRLRFYYLACLNFNAELFLFVIFSTFFFVLIQLFFIYRLSSRSLRNHYLTLSLFNVSYIFVHKTTFRSWFAASCWVNLNIFFHFEWWRLKSFNKICFFSFINLLFIIFKIIKTFLNV
jgi:hypothetical protein